MNRDLTQHELDAWEAGEAARTRSAGPEEGRATLSAMRMLSLVIGVVLPLLIAGVVTLVRHFLRS